MAHYIFKWAISATLALSVASCAGKPKMVHIEGSRPASGTFMFLPSPGAEWAALQPLVRDRLRSNDLQYRETNATYVVQTAISRRPARSGAYVPSEQAKWMRPPYRSPSPLSELTVTISTASDGKEVFRASSGSWSRRPLDIKLAAELVANMFNPEDPARPAEAAAQ